MKDDAITYVVGEEKNIRELLLDNEVLPLLKGLLAAGATSVVITDADGDELWGVRDPSRIGEEHIRQSIILEGEPVGTIQVSGTVEGAALLQPLAQILGVALDTLLKNNLKRLLTTEIHTSVVNNTFDQVVVINAQLTESESRYRELAENLEVKVKERTTELKKAHAHLLQQEKMAAVGQLAAGIAHEINNPLGFITSNLHTLQKYVSRLITMNNHFKMICNLDLPSSERVSQTDHKWRDLKLDAVMGDVGDLLSQSLDGAERVTKIVADLKGFSHVDEVGDSLIDINTELELTLSVLGHELADRAEVIKDFQALPQFRCQPALLAQVFLNIIQNAIQAVPKGLVLTISTAWDGERIKISIADNGPGISHEIRGRVFEPFFTTRDVGSGAGMGLAVVYDTVLKLGGMIAVTDGSAGGADFIITLPVMKVS